MCGIAAVINGTIEHSENMARVIRRRGTHSSSHRVDNLTVSFVHLPITTDKNDQPRTYRNTTVWLNGYISNWKELCTKYRVIADSDTEYLAWHLSHDKGKSELNGFFAVLYYQDGVKMFTDRYGIKQLYTYKVGETTFICSEVKGIKAVAKLSVDFDALNDWETTLGVMTHDTIYTGVKRVDCLPFVKPKKIDNITYSVAKIQLRILWNKACVRNHYEGAGCYLSGGIDSGIIAKDLNPEYSFSVDYKNELSEIDNIKLNSKGLHYTMICNNQLVSDYSNKVMDALDDFKAGSCYTNYAIAETASRFCKVMYSGAGGDEVFNGYTHRYNRDVQDVIKRTDKDVKHYHVTHKEYDWLFLRSVLVVEDRMSGYHTMETRYPLLDNDFVDFALSLPDEYLENKRILKDISGLDEQVLKGKKRGFSNPKFTNEQWINHCKEWL
jgi:asparagine synthase (glutamine-hydrolysing)